MWLMEAAWARPTANWGKRMSTIAGKFKVTNVPIPKEVLDELAERLKLSDKARQKLQGALMVERILDEEYTVEVYDGGERKEILKTKL
jgi:hypothetical protein